MNEVTLYINDTLMDLGGTSIALSFKAFDIGDLNTRNVNYTNRLKIPKTDNNIIALGYSSDEKSLTTRPYRRLQARLLRNGVEVFRDGIAVVVEVTDMFGIEIYSSTFGFFDIVGEKLISDLDLTEYDTYGSQGTLKKPFINYGNLNQGSDPLDYSGNELWCFSYKTVLEEIIKQNGYEKQGDVFSDPKLERMHLAALGLSGYNENFRRPKEFEAFVDDAGVVLNLTTSNIKVPFTNVTKASDFYDGTDTYLVQDPQGGLYGGTYYFFQGFAHLDFEIISGSVIIEIFSNATGPYTFGPEGPGTYSIDLEISDRMPGVTDISGVEGTQLYVRARTFTGTGQVSISSGNLYNKVLPDIFSTYTSVQGIMPELTQKAFIKDFAIRFGVIFSENNGTLICTKIEDIINAKNNAKDWTQKRDKSYEDAGNKGNKIEFEFRSYAQQSYFSYENEDDDVDESVGRGSIDIDNENLDNDTTIYTSPFSNSDTQRIGNSSAGFVTAAYIPVYPDEDDPGLRLVMIRDKYDYEPTLDGPISDYEVGYFIDSLAEHDLSWERFLSDHYTELTSALQRAKLLERYYVLDDLDIQGMDLLRLIYDDGAYYMINLVHNNIPNKSTKCELFKVV